MHRREACRRSPSTPAAWSGGHRGRQLGASRQRCRSMAATPATDNGAGDRGPSPGADPAGSAATITQSRRDRIPGAHPNRGFPLPVNIRRNPCANGVRNIQPGPIISRIIVNSATSCRRAAAAEMGGLGLQTQRASRDGRFTDGCIGLP